MTEFIRHQINLDMYIDVESLSMCITDEIVTCLNASDPDTNPILEYSIVGGMDTDKQAIDVNVSLV